MSKISAHLASSICLKCDTEVVFLSETITLFPDNASSVFDVIKDSELLVIQTLTLHFDFFSKLTSSADL